MTAFWRGVFAGMALPGLWLLRLPIWALMAVFGTLALINRPIVHTLVSWDERLEDAISRGKSK